MFYVKGYCIVPKQKRKKRSRDEMDDKKFMWAIYAEVER